MKFQIKSLALQIIVFVLVLLSGYIANSINVLSDASKYLIGRIHFVLLIVSFGAIIIEIFINEKSRSALQVSGVVLTILIIFKSIEAYAVTSIRFQEKMEIDGIVIIILAAFCMLVVTQIVLAIANKKVEDKI